MNADGTLNSKDVQICFEQTDPAMIEQSIGTYSEECPSCVGAHLANLFCVGMYYENGIDAWLKMMGLDWDEGEELLDRCGAGLYPWGFEAWETPPAIVFARVADKRGKK